MVQESGFDNEYVKEIEVNIFSLSSNDLKNSSKYFCKIFTNVLIQMKERCPSQDFGLLLERPSSKHEQTKLGGNLLVLLAQFIIRVV